MVEKEILERRSLALASKVGRVADAVICTSPDNIYYFTGFRTTLYTRFVAVLIRLERPESPILIVSTVDQRMIEDRIWSPPCVAEIVYHGPDRQAGITTYPEEVLKTHLVVSTDLGSIRFVYLRLICLNGQPQISRSSKLLAKLTKLSRSKINNEVMLLRQANQLAIRSMEKICDLLEAGPTTEIEIAVKLEADARLSGADGFSYPTLVSGGVKMAALHSPPLHRLVVTDQPLRVAFGPTVEGYTADIVRTFCLGNIPRELIRLQDGYLAALDKLLGIILPGAKSTELLSAVEETYIRWGVRSYWKDSIGHGVGITVHEPPRIAAGSQALLSEGMIIAIEPYLIMHDLGGYVQCDVIAVKESEPEILAQGMQGIIGVTKDSSHSQDNKHGLYD